MKDIVISIIFLCALFTYFYINYQIAEPLTNSELGKVFIIQQGQPAREIALGLEEDELIKNDFWFMVYIWYRNLETQLQAGKYLLRPNMSIAEIASALSQGEGELSQKTITIFEGMSSGEIEDLLIAEGLPIEKGEITSANLEGYLFPDTYRFYETSNAFDVIKKMRDNFTAQVGEEIGAEIIIMASIVQKEAKDPFEMRRIAGVFYNRLRSGRPLQSDATINYITGKNVRQAAIADTKIPSPYNTYLNLGLPLGPISNPGLWAIKAALNPEKTSYLYFLHPKDGETIYSKSSEEHLSNKAKYLP